MTRPSLVLLTNWYPEETGDSTFVANEIEQLSAAYNRLLIAPLMGKRTPRWLTVPANASILPPVFTNRAQLVRKGLLNRLSLETWLRLLRDDSQALRTRARLLQFLIATLTGRAVASHRPLRAALAHHPNTDLYFFWGIGAAYALPWLPWSKRTTAIRFHGSDVYEHASNGYLPCRRAILSEAGLLLPVSDNAARHLETQMRQLRLPQANMIAVSRLGTQDRGQGLHRPPSEPRKVHLVSCSSVNDLKRVPLIWDVANELSKTCSTHWTHLGGGPGFPALQRMTAKPRDGLTVSLRGQLSNLEIHAFYETQPVDCFINLSRSEGVPVSILEAASHNIPIVATDVGGTSEFVGSAQRTGRLVNVQARSTTIADAVLDVVANATQVSPRAHWESTSRASDCASRLVDLLCGMP